MGQRSVGSDICTLHRGFRVRDTMGQPIIVTSDVNRNLTGKLAPPLVALLNSEHVCPSKHQPDSDHELKVFCCSSDLEIIYQAGVRNGT